MVVVGLGMFLAMLIGFLLVFGALAPILSVVFGLGSVSPAGILPLLLLIFSVGFAFYFGGMAAAYYARFRRKLHGTLVGVIACAISPLVNLASGNGPFPNVDSVTLAVLLVLAVVVAVGGSYVGAKRGEALYAFNSKFPTAKGKKKTGAPRRNGENDGEG